MPQLIFMLRGERMSVAFIDDDERVSRIRRRGLYRIRATSVATRMKYDMGMPVLLVVLVDRPAVVPSRLRLGK